MSSRSFKLSRNRDQSRALIKGLATSLVMEEKITTTQTKAKALVPKFEKLLTTAKKQNLAAYRVLRRQLTTETAAKKMYDDLAPRFAKRPGGYTRSKSAGWRKGDNTKLVQVSLTESAAPKPAKPVTKTTTKAKSPARVKTAGASK